MSVYVPPAGSGGSGSGTSSGGGFCSGGCGTLADNQRTYLAGYFNAHMLSKPSWRYMYLLWIVAAALALVVAAGHHMRFRARSGSLGARWLRWTIRSRTIPLGRREASAAGHSHPRTTAGNAARMLSQPAAHAPPAKRRRTLVLPPIGTLCMGFVLLVIPVLLTLIGADYVRPSAGVFDLAASFPNITDPTQSLTALPQVSRRGEDVQGAAQLARRRLHWGLGRFPAVTTIVATVTIPYRTWWTAGGRTGIMTNALVPMVVLLALKAPPFALLATRALGGFGFDRLAFLHKWGGRLVWLFAAVHVALWSVQLRIDYAFGGNMWAFVFLWQRFRWGFVSFGFLTLLTLLSIGPIRRDYYEFFYVAHIVCAIGTMVAAALHHPPLGMWLWAPLAWWGAERIYRAARTAWTNGVGFAGRKPQFVVGEQSWPGEKPPAWHGAPHGGPQHGGAQYGGPQHGYPDAPLAGPPPGWASRVGPLSSQGGHSVDSSSATMLSSPPSKTAWLSHDSQPVRGGAPLQHERIALHDEPAGMQMQKLHGQDLAGDGLDRRRTRRSARYDPVSDVIDDYSMDGAETKRFSSSADLYNQAYSSSDSAWSAHVAHAPLPPPHFTHMQSELSASSHTSHATAPYPPPFGHQAQGSFSASGSRPTTPRALQSHAPRPAMGADIAAVIRPGFAFAQVLPGKTLRLTLRTPNAVSWRPGQYVNLNVPAVRWWESHPFTVASAYDANFKSSTIFGDDDETPSGRAKGEERTMVLLLRARHGFTRHLWNYVCDRREEQLLAAGQAARKATTGVHVRALVDGPYGSTASVRWGEHASVLIICGGSGVSYGMAVLEHLCACLSQARQKGFVTTRVRFVWMLREFSHLQWVASALRRCTELVGVHQLQVDLFVTHFNQIETRVPAQSASYGAASRSHAPGPSDASGAGFTEADAAQGEEFNVDAYDLTQFEGEDYSAPSATEMKINERLHSEGKLRRAKTRRATMRKKAGRGGAASRPGRANAPPMPSTQLDLGEPSGPLGDGALLAPPNPFADDGYTSSGPPSPNLLPLFSPGVVPELPGKRERPPSMLKTHSSSGLSAYAGSTHGLLAPDVESQADKDEVLLDLDADEDADVRHVAELAHPGRPRLDRIVQEEARAARGTSLLVTSCGPSSLGALLRAVVAKEIDPLGIGKGTAPRIELRNETYDWGGS